MEDNSFDLQGRLLAEGSRGPNEYISKVFIKGLSSQSNDQFKIENKSFDLQERLLTRVKQKPQCIHP